MSFCGFFGNCIKLNRYQLGVLGNVSHSRASRGWSTRSAALLPPRLVHFRRSWQCRHCSLVFAYQSSVRVAATAVLRMIRIINLDFVSRCKATPGKEESAVAVRFCQFATKVLRPPE